MSVVRTLARLSRLLEHAGADLSLPQYRVLAMVAQGDDRATALAGRLSLSKPTITAAVDGLVERGMVARTEVAGDRRAVNIQITDAGRDALVAAEERMDERLRPVFDHCDDPAAVLAALSQLESALDRVMAERRAEAAQIKTAP
jgi:DNA-binding MarR family transcriptional regulator